MSQGVGRESRDCRHDLRAYDEIILTQSQLGDRVKKLAWIVIGHVTRSQAVPQRYQAKKLVWVVSWVVELVSCVAAGVHRR